MRKDEEGKKYIVKKVEKVGIRVEDDKLIEVEMEV